MSIRDVPPIPVQLPTKPVVPYHAGDEDDGYAD